MDDSPFDLRAVVRGDEEWIFRACQDPEIQRWTLVPRPYSMTDAERFVVEDPEWMRRAVVDTGTDTPVGMIGVHDVVDGTADIGYWIAPWGRRRGAATRAVGLLVAELTRIGSIVRVVARISVNNTASRRTVVRAGFTEQGREPGACPDGDSLGDAVVYRLEIRQGPPAILTAR